MEVQLILNIVTIALLVFVAGILLFRKSKLDIGAIVDLLKQTSGEQCDSIAKQISNGTTEQFERFSVIQGSIQNTLQGNREEINKQFREFQTQIDLRLSAIQQGSLESNERINTSVNKTLQDSHSETNAQFREFQTQIDARLSAIQQGSLESNERINTSVNKTLQDSRNETNTQLREFQAQIDARLAAIQQGSLESNERINTSVNKTLQDSRNETNTQLREFQAQIDARLSATQQGSLESNEKINASVNKTLQDSRNETNTQLREFQTQIDARLSATQKGSLESNERINASVNKTLHDSRNETNTQLREFQAQIDARLSAIQQGSLESNERINTSVNKTLHDNRSEINAQLREFQAQIDARLSAIQQGNAENIEKINATLENKMKSLQESNEKRLEQMQGVVDEKLHKTLETRLAQSFELVGKQLDSVQHGLVEMKNLAADAKSLKNALINFKERGTYGEVRLGKLLNDILSPNQYELNVEIGNNKRVEFAIKLPGTGDVPLLLPIDSKFPIEDYNRLLDAEDKAAIDEAREALAQKMRTFAKDIHENSIMPPNTTDFALMFLPTEGLYAEIVQNAALFEELRDKYKVTVVGATTLSAFLSSLQMGFKTLAIEQRSREVWDTLRAVKSEFGKFGDLLDTAHKQIQRADETLEKIVGVRTRAINKTLSNVVEYSETNNTPSLETSKAGNEELQKSLGD